MGHIFNRDTHDDWMSDEFFAAATAEFERTDENPDAFWAYMGMM